MACQECFTADLVTFRAQFPGLDDVSDAAVQSALDAADCFLDDVTWGCTKPQAILYLAAHQVAWMQNVQAASSTDGDGIVTTGQTAGETTSASAGGLSVSYGKSLQATSGNAADAFYSTTPYGQCFLALRYQRMPFGILASCSGFGLSHNTVLF